MSNTINDETRARLKIMCETNDGFRISEEDLRLRGPGDFFGKRQHGLPEMHIADLCADMNVLQTAQNAAKELLQKDPQLQMPEHTMLAKKVEKILCANSGTIN